MLPTLGGSHLAKDIYHYALAMVQNRGVRFISSLKGVVSVSGGREQLGLQTLEERRKISRLNTLMKVLDYEHLHPVLIDCFNNKHKIQVWIFNTKITPLYSWNCSIYNAKKIS